MGDVGGDVEAAGPHPSVVPVDEPAAPGLGQHEDVGAGEVTVHEGRGARPLGQESHPIGFVLGQVRQQLGHLVPHPALLCRRLHRRWAKQSPHTGRHHARCCGRSGFRGHRQQTSPPPAWGVARRKHGGLPAGSSQPRDGPGRRPPDRDRGGRGRRTRATRGAHRPHRPPRAVAGRTRSSPPMAANGRSRFAPAVMPWRATVSPRRWHRSPLRAEAGAPLSAGRWRRRP